MYGFDGSMTALEFACLFGFNAISQADRARLVNQGVFTADGVFCTENIDKEVQKTIAWAEREKATVEKHMYLR